MTSTLIISSTNSSQATTTATKENAKLARLSNSELAAFELEVSQHSDMFIDLIHHLLPDSTHLRLEPDLLEADARHITLNLTSTQSNAACPLCQQSSHRVHSSYGRTLRDLNWADWAVTLHLSVRKFFCDNPSCKRRIFTERLPKLTQPWARRTGRMTQHIQAVGLSLGGAAGASLMQRFGYSFSRDTVLRCVARMPLPATAPPQKLGVDDFAFRKGQRFGTILVDLDRSRPIALLENREAATLAHWLEQHPGIEVLSRDRSKADRQAMNQGAPNAIQVADRFHLLQNLVEPLEQIFSAHRKALGEIECATDPEAPAVVILPPAKPLRSPHEPHRTQRQSRYQNIRALHQQGYSTPAVACEGVALIAHQLGVSPRTVQRYLKYEQSPQPQPRSDFGLSPTLEPYKPMLLERWNAGCYEARALFQAIAQQGYSGSYMTVARYVRRLRQAHGLQLRQLPPRRLRRLVDRQRQALTPRRAAWLVLRHPDHRNAEEKALLARLKQHPSFAPAIELAEAFINLVRYRQGQHFEPWLAQALQCDLPPLRRFAQSLNDDYAAVQAGLTLDVSNGPTEGHINRLKMLKRQMFGRAGLDLLRRRFLLQA